MTISDDLLVGMASSKAAIFVGIPHYTLCQHPIIIQFPLRVDIVVDAVYLGSFNILDQVFLKLSYLLTEFEVDKVCAFCRQSVFSRPNQPSPIQGGQIDRPSISPTTRPAAALRYSPYNTQRLHASLAHPLGRIISPHTASSNSHRPSPVRFRPQRLRFRPRHYDSSPETTLHCTVCNNDKPVDEFFHAREINPICFHCQHREQAFVRFIK